MYFQGKRTKSWLKMKHLMDDDFVVCGYIDKGDHMTSIVLGQYREQELMYKGHVTLGVSSEAFSEIKIQPSRATPPFADPVPAKHGNEKAVWIEPTLVCTVKFMHRTQNGGMRQPVFKGLRKDKAPLECVEQSENQQTAHTTLLQAYKAAKRKPLHSRNGFRFICQSSPRRRFSA